jgi:hypothetical protein
MSLDHYQGHIISKNQKPEITDTLSGVEVDYYFTASLFAKSKTEIAMNLWTVVLDSEGFAYGMLTKHIGNYKNWKEVILNRIEQHLYKLKVDKLQVRRLIRDIEIKKEGHIIPYDVRMAGCKIGITGADEIYVRKDKFSFYN